MALVILVVTDRRANFVFMEILLGLGVDDESILFPEQREVLKRA